MRNIFQSKIPWGIIFAVAILLVLGVAAIARAEALADSAGRYWRQQAIFACISIFVMTVAAVPNQRILRRASYPLLILTLVTLLCVYAFPAVNNARRWIRFGPIGFQPSEFCKIAFILAMANYLSFCENYRRFRGLLPPFAITFVPMLLILKEPDLGTSLIFLPVLFVMLFTAGANRRDLALIVVIGIAVSPLVWSQMSREQRSRVAALLDQPPPGVRPSDDAYQLHQGKRVRALGGLWGSWIEGEPTDDATAYRLPESHTDFILCVVGERWGIPGVALTLGLFAFLTSRLVLIAQQTKEPFARLTVSGVAALFAAETIVNAGMTVGLLPVTGLALPFLSYGGSNALAHAAAVGLAIGVALRSNADVADDPFSYAVK